MQPTERPTGYALAVSDVLNRITGSAVRAEMARRRLSQERIAAAIGLSRSALQRRIAGQSAFRIDELRAIADLLGVPVTALIEGQPAMTTRAGEAP